MTFLRRLRGIASTALLWAATWGIVGTAAYAVLGVRWTLDAGRPLSVGEIAPYALTGTVFFAVYGLLGGASFAGVLLLVERRGIQSLTFPRIAAWGGLGGIGVLLVNLVLVYLGEGVVLDDTLSALLVMGLLGAGCAAGSLALARRAPGPERAQACPMLPPRRRLDR
ncbi:MAG TPA: hypothetical protein VGR37_05790 [Longimicrobiaceae bacterium]|nr:hypothetical protein [Longimicrobiaceae bacterium]